TVRSAVASAGSTASPPGDDCSATDEDAGASLASAGAAMAGEELLCDDACCWYASTARIKHRQMPAAAQVQRPSRNVPWAGSVETRPSSQRKVTSPSGVSSMATATRFSLTSFSARLTVPRL